MLSMKYYDKNGSEWSIKKGDWVGSFERKTEKKLISGSFRKVGIPVIILILILLFYGFIR
jgi:hypothetical protein